MTVNEVHSRQFPSLAPETIAAAAVAAVTGGGTNHIELRGPGVAPVCICGHSNPAVVREYADKIRKFLAALLQADRDARLHVAPG